MTWGFKRIHTHLNDETLSVRFHICRYDLTDSLEDKIDFIIIGFFSVCKAWEFRLRVGINHSRKLVAGNRITLIPSVGAHPTENF